MCEREIDMSKKGWGGLCVILALGVVLSGCGTTQYKQYVKPHLETARSFIDKYRDPECVSKDCAWKEEVFSDTN